MEEPKYRVQKVKYQELILDGVLNEDGLKNAKKNPDGEVINYLSGNREPKYIEGQSSCFCSSARFGKTYRMMQWAKQMREENKPFIYLLGEWHSHVLEKYPEACQIVKSPKDFSVGESAIIITKFKHDLDEVLSVVNVAISNGYHIFNDENSARYPVLDVLNAAKYHQFTMSIQSIFDCSFYGGKDTIFDYNFDRIFVGKSNDYMADIKICELTGQHCAEFGVGEFLVLEREETIE